MFSLRYLYFEGIQASNCPHLPCYWGFSGYLKGFWKNALSLNKKLKSQEK
jgi:hypothetical protein